MVEQQQESAPATNKANYFELMNLSLGFALDLEKLESNYLKLQAEYHPDNFATADVLHRSLAAKQSSLINVAYKELLNPVSRAKHLLMIVSGGANGGEDATEELSGENTISDEDFLMEQMKWREAIEESDGDSDKLQGLLEEVNKQQAELHQQFGQEFDGNAKKGGAADFPEEAVAKLKGIMNQMRYFAKLQQDLEART